MVRKLLPHVTTALALLTFGACTAGSLPENEPEPQLRAAHAGFYDAFYGGDPSEIARYLAPQVILMPPHAGTVRGREAVARTFAEISALPGLDFRVGEPVFVFGDAGDMAYERATYQMSFTSPQGPVHDAGDYVTVWKKVDGKWRVVADVPSPNPPAPASGG